MLLTYMKSPHFTEEAQLQDLRVKGKSSGETVRTHACEGMKRHNKQCSLQGLEAWEGLEINPFPGARVPP